MARIRKPVRFSDHFEFDSTLLDAAGALNPTLNVDTRLFIDPLLLEDSRHDEISAGAQTTYQEHFSTVIKLLRASRERSRWPRRKDVADHLCRRHPQGVGEQARMRARPGQTAGSASAIPGH
ncbi:MAG TPA: hypothetical protein VFG27_09845 [Pseudomonadales bacterium]|nr:hypothetical protein [Pseudomonadales bacterium]